MIQNKKGRKSLTIISILIIVMLFVTFQMPLPSIVKTPDRQWHVIWKGSFTDLAGAEAVLGTGQSGILEIFFVNHTATANSTYATNFSGLIESWCTSAHLGYSSANAFDTELASSVNFDIVIRVRANKTVCGNGTGPYSIFRGDWLRVNITATTPFTLSDNWMVGVITNNVSTNPFIWMNFWIDDTFPGAGTFTLGYDEAADITEIRLEAFY